MLGIWL